MIMFKRSTFLASLAITLAAGMVVSAAAKKEPREVKVKFDQLSEAVQKTFLRESKGAVIAEVDKEAGRGGKVVYEADVLIDGKNWEIKVAPDGKVIGKKLDDESHEREKDEKH